MSIQPTRLNNALDASNHADQEKQVPALLTATAPVLEDEVLTSLGEFPIIDRLDDGADNRADPRGAKTVTEDDSPTPENWEAKLQNLPRIAEAREVNFEHFKNRYSEDEGRYIIEALRANHKTIFEMEEEQRRRKKKGLKSLKISESTEAGNTWIQRIRIQSEPILGHLKKFAGTNWSCEQPMTFFRPFRDFIDFQPKMKGVLDDLEETWSEAEKLDSQGMTERAEEAIKQVEKNLQRKRFEDFEIAESSEDEDENDDRDDTGDKHKTDSITALRHIRCYVNFVDTKIMPLYDMFNGTTLRKIRFNDLWFLFRLGEVIYSPPINEMPEFQTSKRSSHQIINQAIWRVYRLDASSVDRDLPDDLRNTRDHFIVYSHYIDYDGESYGPILKSFDIEYYDGEKDITSLGVYPIRYAKDSEKILSRVKTQGQRFQAFAMQKHLYHEGWTPSTNPKGVAYDDLENSEHIESNVIIDVMEGYKHHTSWKPQIEVPSEAELDWNTGDDSITIKHWADRERSSLLWEVAENTVVSDGVDDRRNNEFIADDEFISNCKKNKITRIEEEDFIFLPRHLVAYILRGRKFVMVDIFSLRDVVTQSGIFDDLKINHKHKRMVKSLVQSHFRKRELQKESASVSLGQDLIRGKGSGLFILLHGVPGVGKTATAEAVAQDNKKPLFNITCGDLGFTPSEVEKSLNDIFRLAHLWDCVLLLDEADIFLSKREVSDLKRNALVSVFLRVLEYYSGILFLTTNRVGALDEAFRSRLHISLYYEPLRRQQTLDIFQVNIDKLKAIEEEKALQFKDKETKEPVLEIDARSILDYAARYFDTNPPSVRWNGRQIRNAFQIASSLASYDGWKHSLESSDVKDAVDHGYKTVLNSTHFDTVGEAIAKFDAYMEKATGYTPHDAARLTGVRADDFSWSSTMPKFSYGQPQYQSLQRGRGESAMKRNDQVGTSQLSPGQGRGRDGPQGRGRGRGRGGPTKSTDEFYSPGRPRYAEYNEKVTLSRGGRVGPSSDSPSRRYENIRESTPTRAPMRSQMSSQHEEWSNESVEWEQPQFLEDMGEIDQDESEGYYDSRSQYAEFEDEY